MTRVCPTHGPLYPRNTRYGVRWQCEHCSVACWSGGTSTPADDTTRALRHQCHEAFDPLWQTQRRWETRADAYRWLRQVMGVPKRDAHIGCFDAAQCRALLTLLADTQRPMQQNAGQRRSMSGFAG